VNEQWRWILTIILIPLCQGLWTHYMSRTREKKEDLRELVESLMKDRGFLQTEVQELKKELELYKKKEHEMSLLMYESLSKINDLSQELKILKHEKP